MRTQLRETWTISGSDRGHFLVDFVASSRQIGDTEHWSISLLGSSVLRLLLFASVLASVALIGPAFAAPVGAEKTIAAPIAPVVIGAARIGRPDQRAERASAALLAVDAPRDRALAQIIRGMARYEQGDWGAAADDLLQVTDSPAAINDLALFYGAEARFHQGRYADAQAVYTQLIKQHPRSVWRHRARFRIGDCERGRGRLRQASTQWAQADEMYPEFTHQVALGYARAITERLRDRNDQAAARLRLLIASYPNDPLTVTARRTLRELEEAGASPPRRSAREIYQTGDSLRRRKFFEDALMAFEGLLINPKASAGVRNNARIQIGRTLLQMERHAESLATFAQLAKDTLRAPAWHRRAQYWMSQALSRMGRLDEAAKAYAESKPNPKALDPEARMSLGEMYFHGGGYREAAAQFLELAKRRIGNTRWYLAWLNYRLGRYSQARDAFARLSRGSKFNRARYSYWAARSHGQLGEFDAAQTVYTRIATQTPNSYYAYQARARLAEMGRPLPPIVEQPCQGDACDPAGPSDDAVTPLGLLTGRHPNVPGLREAYELAAIGEVRQAKWRLRAIRDEQTSYARAGRPGGWRFMFKPYVDNRKDEERAEWARLIVPKDDAVKRSRAQVDALRSASRDRQFRGQLRDAFLALGDWYYVRRMSYTEDDRVVDPPEDPAKNPLWRRRYGRAYRQLIEAKAAKYGLEPLLLWAFMTVESAYNPWALSRVGARGLMQVMPHTGALIADRMAWRNFGTALLFEPEVVIEMGAWYVHQLLEKFDGQLPFAIAGYNAGPHRVASWLDAKGGLPMDEFIEEIPYNEARAYTKKVLKHLMLYRRIYEGRSDWPVSQVIDPRYKDNINF